MQFPETEIAELKKIAPDLSIAQEGGYTFILLPNLTLPAGCVPAISDVLLCPKPRDGYESRLFFTSQITGGPVRNWNGNIRVLGRNWCAVSWRVKSNLTLIDMLLIHLSALRA
jgi:hypothetical protein